METDAERSRRRRIENPEVMRAYSRKWGRAHPEKTRAKALRWRKANLEKSKATKRTSNIKRRYNAPGGGFTASEFIILKALHGYKCLCCGRCESVLAMLGLTLTPDHVVPLAKGGLDNIGNIQPLCHGLDGCNNHKHTSIADYRK